LANFRILIMAGGTGGHVFPALAVADYLKQRGAEITWLGTPTRMEATLVPQHGIPLDTIDIEGLRGRGALSWCVAPWRLLKATWQAFRIIQRRQPQVVLGMGGFASGPGGVAAWLLRKPLVIHEQNAVAGTTNKLLSRLAGTVCESFPHTFQLPRKLHCTGNPVRENIAAIPEPAQRFASRSGPLRLLILGGSLGAKAINEHLPAALALLPPDRRPEVWHQCGDKHAEATRALYAQLGLQVKLTPFIQDMAEAYAWADYVIARAGALTVTELMAAGLGAILIPFPQAIDDHQTKNAAILVKAGAADLIPQSELHPQALADLLLARYQDRAELCLRAEKARALMQSQATASVAQFCMEAAGATL
jgi:UDP-N-acetylglucosamine--N-acetylmuramyl-(pentapeptide) pyrophosphoryl-undecaprenol N-acetylglucosamine transferase